MIENVVKKMDLQNLVALWDKDPGILLISALALFLAGGMMALLTPASFKGLAKLATPKPLGDTAKKIIGIFNKTCLSGTHSYTNVGMGTIAGELKTASMEGNSCGIKGGDGRPEVSFNLHSLTLRVGGHNVTSTFTKGERKAIRNAAIDFAARVKTLQARKGEIERLSALRMLTA